ncbi:hypothetical protein [Cognatishimia activa]|uniref:hypothetical protein n=1 Tax=Cognatishimia activa TaxID=1715691 RepID=UPI00222ED368|nr:hypothetical protein [Cognatishimia activa]UZD89697.1 hypothetical protein M0D42_08805 [Cognatishimia activa]
MFRSRILWCATGIVIAAQAASATSAVTSECRLLELAYKVTKAQQDTAFSDILVDCPGYESWTFEMTTRDNSLAFREALNAQKPYKVEKGTETAKILFQRMITRGVPVEIAQALVETRAFDNAVAELEK